MPNSNAMVLNCKKCNFSPFVPQDWGKAIALPAPPLQAAQHIHCVKLILEGSAWFTSDLLYKSSNFSNNLAAMKV